MSYLNIKYLDHTISHHSPARYAKGSKTLYYRDKQRNCLVALKDSNGKNIVCQDSFDYEAIEEAKLILSEILSTQQHNNVELDPELTSVYDLIDIALSHFEHTYSATALSSLKSAVHLFRSYLSVKKLRDVKLSEWKVLYANNFMRWLGTQKKKNGKEYADLTIELYAKHVMSLLKKAIREEEVDLRDGTKDSMYLCKPPKDVTLSVGTFEDIISRPVEKSEKKAYTAQEIAQFLNQLDPARELDWKCIQVIVIALYTGLRITHILQYCWSKIDKDYENYIGQHFANTAMLPEELRHFVSKKKRRPDIRLSPNLVEFLSENNVAQIFPEMLKKKKLADAKIPIGNLNMKFKRLAAPSSAKTVKGVKTLTLGCLRHTVGTHLKNRKNGHDIDVFLGWAKRSTGDRTYRHRNKFYLLEIMQELDLFVLEVQKHCIHKIHFGMSTSVDIND